MQYFLRLTCDLPKIAGKLTVGVWKIAKTNPINIMYVCMCVNQIYIYIFFFFLVFIYQILQTNILRIVWQRVRSIADEILELKWLRLHYKVKKKVAVSW